jgi:8-amino-7-oxononanoate synthase
MTAYVSGSSAMQRLADEIRKLKAGSLYRTLRVAQGIDFTSNDYLGLAEHPALADAAIAAIESEGVLGAAGSRLLGGNHPLHEALERRAAEFFRSEAALYFGSGYLANLALFTTLCARHDAVIFDDAVHASMKEGIHAAAVERYRARHNDLGSFAENLKRAREKSTGALWLAVESVYSMDGDFAPLTELAALAREHDATLIVDEAHATGIFGPDGRGLGEGLAQERVISLHTCGKALGVAGALVAAPAIVVEYLINKARPFIFSTAPPPMLAAAVSRALDLVEEEPWRRERLFKLVEHASERLRRSAGESVRIAGSQIIPIILGEDARALSAAAALQAEGFDVRAIRPPTVPTGTSRLRISLNVGHSADDIDRLAAALEKAL